MNTFPPTRPEPAHPGSGNASQDGVREFLDSLAPAGQPRPYTAQQVFAVLKALGYGAGQADLAMSRAITRGSWPLSRHVLRYDGEAGTYAVTARRAS
jgi:hypothetical protein